MWGSTDESDGPRASYLSSRTPRKDHPKPKPAKPLPAFSSRLSTSSKQSSSRLATSSKQSFGAPGLVSDDSVDSDSSNGSDDRGGARLSSGARAIVASSQAQKPKPRSKTTSGASAQLSVSGPDIRVASYLRKESDVRPKTREAVAPKVGRGNVFETPTAATRDRVSTQPSAAARSAQTPASSVSQVDNSFKNYLPGNKAKVPGSSHHVALGQPIRSFEKHHAKLSDSDRGQQYSKRDEKLNLQDFLPKESRSKTEAKPIRSGLSRVGASDHAARVGAAFLDFSVEESRIGMSELKIDDGIAEESYESGSTSRSASRPVKPQEPKPAAARRGNHPAHNSGKPHTNSRKDADDSSPTSDESGDETLDSLLPTLKRYVPPQRVPGGNRKKFDDDFPPPGGRRINALRPERQEMLFANHGAWERRPRLTKDSGNGGQGPGRGDADRNGRERIEPHDDRAGWREWIEPHDDRAGWRERIEPHDDRAGWRERIGPHDDRANWRRRGDNENANRRDGNDNRHNLRGEEGDRDHRPRANAEDDDWRRGRQGDGDQNRQGRDPPRPRYEDRQRGPPRQQHDDRRGPPRQQHDDDRRGPPRQQDDDIRRGPPRQHNAEGGGNNRQQRRPQPAGLRPLEANLSFTRLRELRTREPAEVVAALSYSKEGLSRLLKNEEKLTTDQQMMRLLLGALAKVSQCHSMPAQTGEILNLVRTNKFLHNLGTFLTIASMRGQATDVPYIIGDSADLLRTLVMLFPSHLHEVVMAHAFIEVAEKQARLRGALLPEDILKKVADLEIAKEAAVEGLQRKQTRARGGIVDEDALTPPDDFRLISVFPTLEDLSKDELPFLRKNKQVGGYAGVDHYLDVQFRLLREDFVYPLREGIAEYLAMVNAPQRGRRLKDIRVYHDVHILRAVCLTSGLGHRLAFDVSHMKRVKWEVSKRLIYGSLICLSTDNFRTLFFATVVNRDAADLKEGLVDVMFEHDLHEISAIAPETGFTMAETTAFFEAYRHVLTGLQRIPADQLPFHRYIVTCDQNVVEPIYLANARPQKRYDLRPLVDDSVTLREDQQLEDQGREVAYQFSGEARSAESVPVLQKDEWPDPELLKLDASQYEALQTALTKEFSVIQGPPGTGKTYVGLKMVKALLHNRKAWDPELASCMLIVCYTNHALDQFLEGVVSFFKGRVVRVGSRSRSEKLEPFSLSNLRWSMRKNRDDADRDFREITRLRFQGHDAMERLMKDIDVMGLKVEAAKREIVHEEVLMPYMLDKHYDRLQDARPYIMMQQHGQFMQQGKTKKRVFCIPEWLGIGTVLQNSHVTAQDLEMLEMELGEDEAEIEGEIQALEEQNKLDNEDHNRHNTKAKEKKKALAEERTSYLAVDISKMDQGMDDDDRGKKRGGGGGGGRGGGRGGGGGGGEGGFQIPKQQWKKLKRKLRRNVEQGERMTDAEERQVHDIWNLEFSERWKLYRRWTHSLCVALQTEMRERERLYDELARRQKETLMQEDKHILKTATVIAMTTTGAAKYQSVLQEVKPKVIVVEEAAEVLEGHVITTLSQDCQHLILIGDHKQLRPNPNVFALARKYNLELSLFERMINNGLKCVTLGWQHRMRPEIASLVKPIYPALENHPSVEGYEAIKGVSSNLFFISHSMPEAHDDETKSHSNLYEALYVAQLCSYLLKQGYDPSRITVLTTYSGQLFQLRKLMPKKSEFDGVRVTVVDNFQGEENDIILLSLVRSNEDGNIGFLKIENRVCVALSRAKMGLYVIGNFDLLTAESNLWQTITAGLRKEGQIGEALNLYCQNHPNDEGLVIRTPEDFGKAPEGGCMKPCTARLDCGHVCTRMCHPYDKDHEEYQCLKQCEKRLTCEYQHPCKKLCYQACGECKELVRKKITKCGHHQWMLCSLDPLDFVCQEDCRVLLPCGHKCGDRCGERHRCYEKVEHRWPCGHTGEVYCADKDKAPCPQACDVTLACGHKCKGTCRGCHSGRLHQRCRDNCTKILVCGHACRDTCSNCPPCDHKCENRCVHSSCRKRCGLPCAPCTEPCVWRCPHHRCTKLCGQACNRPRCDQPCPKLLKCDHPCIGLCGEPCPKLCRVCHQDTVTTILFGDEDEPDARFVQLEDCVHIVEVTGLDKWMTTATDSRGDSVQLKACPHCKTPIRRNLRYGAVIKTQLKDIETIKNRMLGDEARRSQTLAELEDMVERETHGDYEDMRERIFETGDRETLGGLVAMVNQMKMLDQTKKLTLFYKDKVSRGSTFPKALKEFEEWVCSPRLVFSDQEERDAETELTRLKHWLSLENYVRLSGDREEPLPSKLADPVNNMLRRMKVGRLYTEDHQKITKLLLKHLEELIPASDLGISEKERDMVVKAMQLPQGHWFKCLKGHIYAIGDCGGATEESQCPECKQRIGGQNHQLRTDNTLASEMDGARHAAWSEQNNLQNFRLEDLL